MKKYISIVLLVLCSLPAIAQKKEKIKGNREVTTVIYELDPFTAIDIREDIEVVLINGTKSQVEVNTDENLHEVFDIHVVNGTLTIATTKEIRSSKRLEIFITVSDTLQRIHAGDDVEIKSLTTLAMNTIELNVMENAEMDLKIRADSLTINGYGKTKQRYEIFTNQLILTAFEDADIQATAQATNTIATVEHADVELEGTTETLALVVKEKGEFMASDFVSKEIDVTATDQAKIAVQASQKITIDANDRAEISLLGNPSEINMRVFDGEAVLQKVDIHKKGFLKRIF
ncbi:GIN domain-containing protein [Kordia zhangzhouensis]|uniref:GIN domain-containing protein n=1 Tax=Kordia zhangzhouensis TaxID=1620405 RepID=UPI000629236C|nr:DUF2807 domain-containing protein [Kordia zhangzhouensis]